MRNGRKYVFVLSVVIVLILLTSAVYAAEYPIDYVLQHAKDLVNTNVTVHGLVSNSEVVQSNPMDDIQLNGQFTLADKSGTILVKTTVKPPPNGDKVNVTGTVGVDETGNPFILKEGGFSGIPPIYFALGALVLVAIILVAMLAKGSRKKDDFVDEAIEEPAIIEPEIVASNQCPRCMAPVTADDNFCGKCQFDLRPSPPPIPHKSAPTVETRTVTNGRSNKPTVGIVIEEPVLADLMVVDGNGTGRGTRFKLGQKKTKIGRTDGMDIRLDDETVSREHATVWYSDGTFYIQDEASTSGTLVNGEKVARQSLNDNDEIQLGKTRLVFRMIGSRSDDA